MRFASVIFMTGATLCFGPWTTTFCERIGFHLREDPASTDVDEDDLMEHGQHHRAAVHDDFLAPEARPYERDLLRGARIQTRDDHCAHG